MYRQPSQRLRQAFKENVFADDTSVFYVRTTPDTIIEVLNEENAKLSI